MVNSVTFGSLDLLAEIRVLGPECVPWQPPRTIRVRDTHVHLKDKDLVAWQDAIRLEAGRVYQAEPYEGPVLADAIFWKGTPNQTMWYTPWFSSNRRLRGGDQTNYWKAAEDAIATRRTRRKAGLPVTMTYPGVIANDSQVVVSLLRKVWGPTSGVEVRIFAIKPCD